MIPQDLRPLFWDTNLDNYSPAAYPAYTIARVLEFGDEKAIVWLRETFSEVQIIEVLRTERRLSRKSANFWALIYHVPKEEIAALQIAI
jgi:hypothetical protein